MRFRIGTGRWRLVVDMNGKAGWSGIRVPGVGLFWRDAHGDGWQFEPWAAVAGDTDFRL